MRQKFCKSWDGEVGGGTRAGKGKLEPGVCVSSSKGKSLPSGKKVSDAVDLPFSGSLMSLKNDAMRRLWAGLCRQVGQPTVSVAIIRDRETHIVWFMQKPHLCHHKQYGHGPIAQALGWLRGEAGCHPQDKLSRLVDCLEPLVWQMSFVN